MRRPKKYRRRRIPWFVILLGIFVAVIVGGIAFYKNQQAGYNFPFPCLSEVANYHIHPYLRIVINGENITIPAAIGIVNPQYQNGIAVGGTCFEPLHTHDATGIIHVESPVVFSNTDILGFRADSTHRIVLLVDGQPSSEYQSLVLNTLDYCRSTGRNVPPCYPTAGGDPAYGGIAYPYGTEHTIVIEYLSTA